MSPQRYSNKTMDEVKKWLVAEGYWRLYRLMNILWFQTP